MKKKNLHPFSNLRNRFTWLNWQIIGLVVIVILFVLMLFASRYLPGTASVQPSYNSTEFTSMPTPTLLPPEYYETTDKTNGIILGGMLLVIIIIAGATFTRQRDK